jgi:hypothetical protein
MIRKNGVCPRFLRFILGVLDWRPWRVKASGGGDQAGCLFHELLGYERNSLTWNERRVAFSKAFNRQDGVWEWVNDIHETK